MPNYPIAERVGEVNGIKGKFSAVSAPVLRKNNRMVHVKQSWKSDHISLPDGGYLVVKLRFDDECCNWHQSFSITGDIYRKYGARDMGGCIHDEIARFAPSLAPLIKWHLTSTDGPMHYLANTRYHIAGGNFDYARSTAVWPEVTDDELQAHNIDERLKARLPSLIREFEETMKAIGFLGETRLVG